jgi:cell division protein FtsI (penicillin-binding protein 3)
MSTFARGRGFRARAVIVSLLLAAGAVFVMRRAVELQVEEHAKYKAMADDQSLRTLRISPLRGSILDRHGAELAVSVPVDSIYVDPRYFQREGGDPKYAARKLAEILSVTREVLERRLSSDKRFAWLERRVLPEQAERVKALGFPGVSSVEEMRRYYPNRSLAAHVLGFANIDGAGIEGLELAFEDQLRGMVREVPAMRDARGRIVYSDLLIEGASQAGLDLELTLDKTIQDIVETELALGVQTFEAKSGSVVVLDPSTGEVLAMANVPTFNPNAPSSSVAARRNRAITDRFEPGSTVKTFTIASALEQGTIDAEQIFDCENGLMRVGDDDVIRDTHAYSLLTPARILAHSSNIGTAKIGATLGREGLYRAFRRFGFGSVTGVPLPGETSGRLTHFGKWYEMDAVTIAFGQGFSTNALQLALAMGTIANGGRLMEPMLVRSLRDELGQVVEEHLPRVRRRVVSEETAELVSEMLTAVTGPTGTAEEAAIEGFLVAGKTGTAQKADERGLGYAKNRWVASFVGFVPADEPRLVIAVIVDEPVVAYYGGVVAGPIFRRIAEASLRHLGVLASDAGSGLERIARAKRLEPQASIAPAGESPAAEKRILGEREVVVPALEGLSARAAMRRLAEAGLAARLEGTGVVREQHPVSGTILERASTVRVKLGAGPARRGRAEGGA